MNQKNGVLKCLSAYFCEDFPYEGPEKGEWKSFEDEAIKNKVVPLLFCFIIKKFPEKFPSETRDAFTSYYLTNARNTLAGAARLLQVVQLLKSANIQAVPFKGVALAQQVYGDLSLRHLGDTDLLVSQADALRAIHLLESLGYTPTFKINERLFKSYSLSRGGIELVSTDGLGAIDLHWEATSRYSIIPFDYPAISPQLKRVALLNFPIPALASEDLLIMLCFQGAKDRWRSLERLFCLAFLIRNTPEMAWERVMETIKKLHGKRVVLYGLYLSTCLMGIELPRMVMEEIQGLEKHFKKLLTATMSGRYPVDGPDTTRFSWFHFQLKDSWQDRVRFFLRLLFQPSSVEWNTIGLPFPFIFGYRLIRPVRLGGRMIQGLYRKKPY